MLQSVQRRDSQSLVILKHPQDEVLKLEIVGRCVTRLAQPTTAWTSSLHAQDVVKSSAPGRLVLQTASFSLSATEAVM